jgi:hypothetical protein
MEARIQQKFDDHLRAFKNSIRDWLVKYNANITAFGTEDITDEFLQFMFDSENVQLQKEDFQRRKRVKNHVPVGERCCAKRANGEQCTRRMLGGMFCGTHSKGAPHGVIDQSELEAQQSTEKVEIWMQDIQGISYYIDKNNRVYSPEDIVANKSNPRVIGRWETTMSEQGTYKYNLSLTS